MITYYIRPENVIQSEDVQVTSQREENARKIKYLSRFFKFDIEFGSFRLSSGIYN